MNTNQSASMTKLANSLRHNVNAREAGLWEFRFKGKPEGTDAVTLYPNLLAEIVMYQVGRSVTLEEFADAANISYPVFAAVIEDGETLSLEEMRGMQRLIASCECAAHSGCYDALSLDYLLSPALSLVYPDSNKGRFLRWKFERTKDEAFSRASGFVTGMDEGRVNGISDLYRDCHSFYYAGFRQTMNGLKSAIWKADSLRRIAEAMERDRERPARRERRFNRKGATV